MADEWDELFIGGGTIAHNSIEEYPKSLFQMKVMKELLYQAKFQGVDREDLIEFLGTQVQGMFDCPPNYNFLGKKAQVWIMRGFYPGSALFFKLVLVKNEPQHHNHYSTEPKYYAKVTPMRINFRAKNPRFKQVDDFVMFQGKDINDVITKRMENSLLGSEHEISSLIHTFLRMPRCMSPKGMKVFNYKKPSKRRKK